MSKEEIKERMREINNILASHEWDLQSARDVLEELEPRVNALREAYRVLEDLWCQTD